MKFETPSNPGFSRTTINFDTDYVEEDSALGIVESQPWNLASLPGDYQDILKDTYAEQDSEVDATIAYKLGVRTHAGKNRQRRINGDRIYAQQWHPHYRPSREASGLLMVVDGGVAGQALSRHVIDALADVLVPMVLAGEDEGILTEKLFATLQTLIPYVQKQFGLGEEVPGVFVALLIHSTAFVVELGTCRAYLLRGTQDIGRLQDFSPEHLHGDIQLHVWSLPLEADDVLIGCTDGIWRHLPEPELSTLLDRQRQEPAGAAYSCVEKALERGSDDHLSIVITTVLEGQA